MGDRVSVTLTVLSTQSERARQIIKEHDGGSDDVIESSLTTDFEFDDVNYGNLDCENHLTAAGVAWVKSWGAGVGFTAGTCWQMFNEDGSLHANDYHEELPEYTLAPFFKLIDTPEALALALANIRNSITPPPWENQEEFGKRYLTTQLLNPPQT